MHTEVLCKFFVSQNLQNNLSLGTVHAADICPFFPQALQALACTVAPLYQFFSLYASNRRDALSIFIIMLRTSSQVDLSVICSCTLMSIVFSWIVLSRHMIGCYVEATALAEHLYYGLSGG